MLVFNKTQKYTAQHVLADTATCFGLQHNCKCLLLIKPPSGHFSFKKTDQNIIKLIVLFEKGIEISNLTAVFSEKYCRQKSHKV
jgi:hypothetical protein